MGASGLRGAGEKPREGSGWGNGTSSGLAWSFEADGEGWGELDLGWGGVEGRAPHPRPPACTARVDVEGGVGALVSLS